MAANSSSAGAQPVLSPCVGVCALDVDDYCIGCKRSSREIALWGILDPAERQRIMDELESRGRPLDA